MTKIKSECERLAEEAKVLQQTVRNLELLARQAGQAEAAEVLDAACTEIHEAKQSLIHAGIVVGKEMAI